MSKQSQISWLLPLLLAYQTLNVPCHWPTYKWTTHKASGTFEDVNHHLILPLQTSIHPNSLPKKIKSILKLHYPFQQKSPLYLFYYRISFIRCMHLIKHECFLTTLNPKSHEMLWRKVQAMYDKPIPLLIAWFGLCWKRISVFLVLLIMQTLYNGIAARHILSIYLSHPRSNPHPIGNRRPIAPPFALAGCASPIALSYGALTQWPHNPPWNSPSFQELLWKVNSRMSQVPPHSLKQLLST